MKKIIAAALFLVAMLFALPILGHLYAQREGAESKEPVVLAPSGHTITVLQGEEVIPMDLDHYLWGVVAAEMPASFQEEALKAQAVAARTYALRKAGKAANHPQADICTDFRCCQAWISREEAEANWGGGAEKWADRITTAVGETSGQVILYNGALIDAVFHSSSGDNTLDAVEVWGNQVPYLVSVPSPEGEEVPNFHSEVTFTPEEFRQKFLNEYPEAVLEGSPVGWFQGETRAASGAIAAVEVGGIPVSGSKLRVVLNLRSPDFTITAEEDSITFSVVGFGHGVGMSQFGANALAGEGKDYREILLHYYTGVTVEDCPPALYPE